jgi:hypothetical protein
MKRLFLAACLLAAAGAGEAAARPLPSGGLTAEEVAAVLRDAGYRAEIGVDKVGDPQVKSAAEGVEYNVNFYGCQNGRCKSIQFSVGFDMKQGTTMERMNDWSRRFRFGKVYIDDENDPYLQMDLDVEDGVTTEFLKSNVLRWNAVLGDFKKHIDW